MEVRSGYTKTEIGVLPENWVVKPLGQLFAFKNGVNADKQAYGSGVRFVNVLETITTSHMVRDDIAGRVTLPAATRATYAVRRGDVLFNRTSETDSELALASTYIDSEEVVFGGFVIRGRPTSDDFDPDYSGYALRARVLRAQIVPLGQGAVRANIGQESLGQVLAPVPPVAEQRVIAIALRDMDALLSGLDRLIAKKRDLKQAAMQQLLTGQTRLPGFQGEWEVRRLDEVADIRSGGTPSTNDPASWDGGIDWCTPTDITALAGRKYLSSTARRITAHGLKQSSAEMIPAGSVVMTSRATIGECAINAVPMTTNQGFKNFVPFDHIDAEFLYYLLLTQKAGFVSLCGGSTFLEIGKTQLRSYKIRLPAEKFEQTTIAAVLSDMDTELTTLEARRDKTRALKQGMMQELLTGRTRLV